MLSQADVAREAGVSVMTVSRVINGAVNVRPETRERVLKAIRELSYHPNAAARALTRNRASVLEVLIPHEDYFYSSEYFSELIFGVEKVVHDSDYNLIFNTYDPGTGAEYAALYRQRKVDGLLIVAPAADDPSIAGLYEEGVPFVLVNGRTEALAASFVDVDNVGGAGLAVEYLYDLGHRRIGIITGNMLVVNARHRLKGYLDFLSSRGVPTRDEWIYRGNWSEQSGYAGLTYFMELKNAPSAIFCSNDLMAIGALRAAADLGLAIPEAVSIVGYDDIRLSSFVNPRLTTIHQPTDLVGKTAAEMMLELLGEEQGGPVGPRGVLLQPELVIRKSCEAP
jgi:DNA-binding LacI/PurR family transcriptional regulator